MNESVMVYTYKSKETILKYGGSQSWKLNPNRVKKCEYIICFNNSTHSLSENKENFGQAFFVGKISNVKRNYGFITNDRWIIEFDEYAEINMIDNWKITSSNAPYLWGGWRNPVIYLPTKEVKINFDKLLFKKAPERDLSFIEQHGKMEKEWFQNLSAETNQENIIRKENLKEISNKVDSLTIEEAKIGLSKYYNIPEENIEIILRG